MQDATNLVKPLSLIFFVFQKDFNAVHVSDKLKSFREAPFKNINEPTEVTHELLTQVGNTIHTHRHLTLPYYPKKPCFFPDAIIYGTKSCTNT